MTDYPFVTTLGALSELFDKILNDFAVPSAVTQAWLAQIGFKSKNHRRFIPILKFIGFIDSSGKPTPKWTSYLDKSKSGGVLAEGIKEGYASLFSTYTNAQNISDEELTNFFRVANPNVRPNTISRIVSTFKTLCSLADFSIQNGTSSKSDDRAKRTPAATIVQAENDTDSSLDALGGEGVIGPGKPAFSPDININIQIHIAADASNTQIDKIFESMAEHLFNRDAK